MREGEPNEVDRENYERNGRERERKRGNGTNYPRRRMEREKKAKGGIYKVEERWINNEKERKRERGIKKEASVMLEM